MNLHPFEREYNEGLSGMGRGEAVLERDFWLSVTWRKGASWPFYVHVANPFRQPTYVHQMKATNGNSPKRLGDCLADLSTIDMKESQTSRANQMNAPKTHASDGSLLDGKGENVLFSFPR